MNKFPVVILDNGSDLIKIGNRQTEKPSICHNALLKTNKNIYIADEIDSIQNTFNIFNINRPFSNSILTDFDLQNEIWNKVFNKMPQTKLNQKSLLMTESLLNPKLVRSNICETIFEKFDFNALMLSNGLKFAPSTITNPLFNKNCCVVVDCGYSNTRIVPIVNGVPINFAAKTTIGSKLLNERLGQVLSFRQFDVKKDYFLTEKIRINSCYISNNFETELNEIKEKSKAQFVVLPDGVNIQKPIFLQSLNGLQQNLLSTNPQILKLTNETITIPEILFHPSDIGIKQEGVHQSIISSIMAVPEQLHSELYKNILLTGGTSLTKNFKKRLEIEMRGLVPIENKVKVYSAKNAMTSIWEGAKNYVNETKDFYLSFVTKYDYNEKGEDYCHNLFSFE